MLKIIKRKAIVCDMNKPDEKELWEWLQTQPHGVFSEVTKQFWRMMMENNPNVTKIMHDEFWEKIRREYQKLKPEPKRGGLVNPDGGGYPLKWMARGEDK